MGQHPEHGMWAEGREGSTEDVRKCLEISMLDFTKFGKVRGIDHHSMVDNGLGRSSSSRSSPAPQGRLAHSAK